MADVKVINTKYLPLFALAVLSVLSGCSSGCRAQMIPPPESALENAAEEASQDPLIEYSEYLQQDWWQLFNDPQLSEFIETAFEQNPTLQQAHTKIILAAANANKMRATLFPYLMWGADVARQKLSETGLAAPFTPVPPPNNLPPFPPGGTAGIPIYFTQWETEFTLTYEFDIWGKNKNTMRAALDEVRAKMADEAFARLQLSTSLARVYFQLQIDYKRQEIAEAQIKNRRDYLDYIRMRANKSLENEQATIDAEIYLAQAKQDLLQIQGNIAVNEYQLRNYLAGDFEDVINNIQIVEQPLPKVPLPQNIPMHLLSNRPDIIAQLWLIESAGRQIDVAKAGFYPDFNLTALFGYQTLHLHELFKWPSTYYTVDPAVSLPIFDGGRLLANLHGSESNYDLAIFEYNSLVLNAAKEVLDGIAVLRVTEKQLQEYKNIRQLQEQSAKLTDKLVAHNLNSGLNQVLSESNVLYARDQEMIALENTYQAIISLIKALGGGYDACYEQG